ncbi:MAG: glucose sorbosone dehydrogenase [Fibrobacteria bacterium]|jgi:hypothetical protein|nr:glucose sorbosone dehydrogenase [Fibrobacteria bacterium]
MKRSFPRFPAALLAGYLASCGTAFTAFHFFDPADTAAVPKLLSQTGLYTDIAAKVPDTALKYFDLNAPLWSDGAAKQRWMILPPGKQVLYEDTTDLFEYPDSTVFVKTFLLDRVTGDSTTRRYWETRLLVHRKSAQGIGTWHGFSYRWNGSATEARLVSLETGFDTVFHGYTQGLSGPGSYRKWHFPSRQDCDRCHIQNDGGGIAPRTILGFFPAQLKRPAPLQPSLSQIEWLFNRGAFTGTGPTAAQSARRWKNILDPIPASLSSEERFRVIDTMARSYIAANCSGCHSRRGMPRSDAPENVNYDFYDLVPRIEMGLLTVTKSMDLNVEDTVSGEFKGRLYYLDAVGRSGLSSLPGAVWDMEQPGSGVPVLVYPGFPSYSTVLFRQWVRQTPARDSADMARRLASADAQGWGAWIFSKPWGTPGWFQLLEQHGVAAGDVLEYEELHDAMPPVPVSFIPDVEAMKILGEWVKAYRTLQIVDSSRIITGVLQGGNGTAARPALRFHNGMVLVPPGWKARPELLSPAGRRHALLSAGPGRYALPARLPSGIYWVRAGGLSLRVAVLR